MASYKLSNDAQADLVRIHQWGVRTHGEKAADDYLYNFFDRFEKIALAPLQCPSADEMREGYRRSLCGVDTIYFRLSGESVEIMAILRHQNSEEWL